MAKKKQNKMTKYIKYGAILFSIIGIIMIAFSFVNYGDNSFNGFQIIFGYTGKADFLGIVSLNTQILSFSIMALLAVLLPLIGCFSILSKNKIIRLLGALLMVAGAVLCFLVPNFIVFAKDAYSTLASAIGASLGIGAILSGVFFSIGAICNLYAVIEK